MALFEEIITPRRLVVDPGAAPAETLDSFMKVVVGLGNPGKAYENTRHNLGFMCTDSFAKENDLGKWQKQDKFKALIAEAYSGGQKLLAVKPQTFMNLSGESLQAIQHFYKCLTSDIVVIHDELDLPLGTIRMKLGGSDAGHNGIKSISGLIGQDYWHIRIGIGPTPEKIEGKDYVLGKLNAKEKKLLPKITDEVNKLLNSFIAGKAEPQTVRIGD
jgi:PTH1 family peptidyl-tRNA hydrolase